jgi:hypothetical protein
MLRTRPISIHDFIGQGPAAENGGYPLARKTATSGPTRLESCAACIPRGARQELWSHSKEMRKCHLD